MQHIPLSEYIRRYRNPDDTCSCCQTSSNAQGRSRPCASASTPDVRPPPGFPSRPQRLPLIRTPPGFPSRPQNPPANAIQTSPPQPESKLFNIVSLESWPNKPLTAFLLVDASNGNIFHGTLQADIGALLQQYLRTGIPVTDFRVGNRPILPVCDTYLYPRFSEGKGTWTKYTPSPTIFHQWRVQVKRPQILQRREFAYHSNGAASRLRNEIAICERISRTPSPYLADYRGVEVDSWGRVTGTAYRRYTSNLLDFAQSRYLKASDVPHITQRVFKALNQLHEWKIAYGIVGPENVYIDYMEHLGGVQMVNVVLGDFEHAVDGNAESVGETETALVKVWRDVYCFGQRFKGEEEEVWEVKCELEEWFWLRSLEKLVAWMRTVVVE